jgi:hydrogenase maturation protein HypF
MARVIVDQARRISREFDVRRVGLCGGVFQNRVLAGLALDGLATAGFDAVLPERLPCNDAALSFGQAAEVAALG